MGLSYSHLLIPADDEFRPKGQAIAEFLKRAIELGVIPRPKLAFYRVNRVQPQAVRARNPFTGERFVLRSPTRLPAKPKELKNTSEIPLAVKGAREFNVQAYGTGVPRITAIAICFSKPYSITVTACVRSRPVSLSDLHEESGSKRKREPFDEDCDKRVLSGLFTHPNTLKVIEVRRAGRGRFWIEFELGKFLFPKIRGGNLSILNPRITKLAKHCFGIDFLQGCSWG